MTAGKNDPGFRGITCQTALMKYRLPLPFVQFILFLLHTVLSSHEFWLKPQKFSYEQGDEISVRFFVGENFMGENWTGNQEKVRSLTIFYGGVKDDLSPLVGSGTGDSLVFTMLDAGTVMIAFHSTNSFINLEPDKFNSYLKEDGLQKAIDYREENGETDSLGYEYYQRCAKTLFQVGDLKDKTCSLPTGLPVDIIPADNPFQLSQGDSLTVKILFQDTPAVNTLVKIWHRENELTEKTDIRSDENGEIKIPVLISGTWMISTVIMERIADDPQAQWQSYWGSLTWGYE